MTPPISPSLSPAASIGRREVSSLSSTTTSPFSGAALVAVVALTAVGEGPLAAAGSAAAANPPTSPRHITSLLFIHQQAQKFANAVILENWNVANRLLEGFTDDQRNQLVSELSQMKILTTEIYNGNIPLHLAVRVGYTEIVRILVEASPASINIQNKSGNIPLHLAAFDGHTEIVRILVEASPASINIQNKDGNTPLHFAASHGHTEIVRSLVAASPALADIQDKKGNTPLHFAAYHGYTESVRSLVAASPASINTQNKCGNIPLHLAAYNGHTESIRILVAASPAYINIQNKYGNIPLDLAAYKGRTESVRILLNALPALEVLENSRKIALRFDHIAIPDLIQRSIRARLLRCGLVTARDADAAPSSLRTFVCSRIYEPRVMRIVLQYL